MKAVMLSIRPEWCEKIAQGRKTIEVRKTSPKLQPPFKCYIYCTKDKYGHLYVNNIGNCREEFPLLYTKHNATSLVPKGYINGMVIGEFVCDEIYLWNQDIHDNDTITLEEAAAQACLVEDVLLRYADGYFYGWHISELKIYDRPKMLSEFIIPSAIGCCNEGKCRGCNYFDSGNGFNVEDDCTADFDTDAYKPLAHPPQSWCYVEDNG